MILDRLLATMALQRTLSLGYIRQRWMRTGLIVASIALGVATLVATRALNANLAPAAKGNRQSRSPARPHLLKLTNGHDRRAALVSSVSSDQAKTDGYGIREVMPMTLGRVILPELDNRSVLLLGVRRPHNVDLGKLDIPKAIQAARSLGLHVEIKAAELARAFLSLPRPTLAFLSQELADELAGVSGSSICAARQ